MANAAQAERWNGDSGRRWVAQRRRHAEVREPSAPRLLAAAAVRPGERVLDVGCGCGELTQRLAAASGVDGLVVGLDISAVMLAAARDLAAAAPAAATRQPATASPDAQAGRDAHAGRDVLHASDAHAGRDVLHASDAHAGRDVLHASDAHAGRDALHASDAQAGQEAGTPTARYVLGDAQTPPFRPGTFDVVVSSYGVLFFDDPAAAFASLRALLRPGGRLAFLSWQDDAHNELFGLPLRAFAAHGVPLEQSAPDLFAEPDRVAGLLIGAGFSNVRAEPVRGPARLGADVADVLDYTRGTSRVRDLLAGLDEARATRVMADLAERYRARERGGGVWVETASWLVTAQS